MQDLSIAYIQADLCWEDAAANRAYFEIKILEIAQKVDLIILPETFTTGFPVNPNKFAETLDGDTIHWMQKMANHTGSVVCGSILLRRNDLFFNSLVWMRPNGNFETYDKRHVFRMGGEHELIEPGQKKLFVEINGWKIKPMICYDLRFPVWCRNTFKNGEFDYDLAIFVANWPAVRAYPWKQLLIARAIENQSFVIGLNRVGVDNQGYSYSGDSCLIDPKGNYLSVAEANTTQTIVSTLHAADLINFRESFMVGLDWDNFTLNMD